MSKSLLLLGGLESRQRSAQEAGEPFHLRLPPSTGGGDQEKEDGREKEVRMPFCSEKART